MTDYGPDLRKLWLSIHDEVAGPIADLRDDYLVFRGMHRRFSQLQDVYHQLTTIETAIFEFLEHKQPVFGKKPTREMFMVASAAVENAKVLLEIARSELQFNLAEKNA